MDPKVWNGTDKIYLTYLYTQTQNTPFIGSTFLRPAYGIWERKNVGGVKKENMWPFGLGSLMFFKVTQAQFGKNLDENLAKNELENLHKRNLSRFKFSIFIPVSPPVRKKNSSTSPTTTTTSFSSWAFFQVQPTEVYHQNRSTTAKYLGNWANIDWN